jgi:hypothetical protein
VQAALDVKLQVGEGPVKLGQLKELTDNLQRTLATLASQLAGKTDPGVDFEIVRAAVGSLSLSLRAVAEEGAAVEPERVVTTFTSDLADIRRQSYRADLTPTLTRRYRALVTCLKDQGAVVEYRQSAGPVLIIDDAFRQGFDVALKERVAEDVSVVGHLDAVNAHRPPYTFYLYPKLQGEDRVECRFAVGMLGTIAELIKKTVKVEGTGHFAPVGVYPVRMDVRTAPHALVWDAGVLRSYVGKLRLVPEGMTVSGYLERNREAAGLAS